MSSESPSNGKGEFPGLDFWGMGDDHQVVPLGLLLDQLPIFLLRQLVVVHEDLGVIHPLLHPSSNEIHRVFSLFMIASLGKPESTNRKPPLTQAAAPQNNRDGIPLSPWEERKDHISIAVVIP